jgi:hypothetical protein
MVKTQKGGARMKKKTVGSSFDSWLREEGIDEDVSAGAIKRVLARQVEAAIKDKHFSKAEMRGGCTPAGRPSTDCSTHTMTP